MSRERSNRESIARLQIITAMIFFGTLGLFVKNIALPSAEIALWRGAIAFIVLLLFMLFSGRLKKLYAVRTKIALLFISGAVMGFNWILFFEAYNYTSVALTTLSYYFAPTVVIIFSTIIFKERINFKQVLCFLGSTGGLFLIIGVSGGGSNDLIGILFGLGAAVLYATVVLINKATGMIDGVTRTWLQFGSAVIVLLPYVYLTGGFNLTELDYISLANLLILAVVHTGFIYYLYFTSLAYLRGQQAAILSYIDPLIAVLVSLLILRESITAWQLIGGFFILFFTLLNEIKVKLK